MFTSNQKIWMAVALFFFIANMVVITFLAVRMKNEKEKEKQEQTETEQTSFVDPGLDRFAHSWSRAL